MPFKLTIAIWNLSILKPRKRSSLLMQSKALYTVDRHLPKITFAKYVFGSLLFWVCDLWCGLKPTLVKMKLRKLKTGTWAFFWLLDKQIFCLRLQTMFLQNWCFTSKLKLSKNKKPWSSIFWKSMISKSSWFLFIRN